MGERRRQRCTTRFVVALWACGAGGCYLRHEAHGVLDAAPTQQADGARPEPSPDGGADAGPKPEPDAGTHEPPLQMVCAEATADCNARSDDRCETDLRFSREHCGACGAACDAAHAATFCDDGACRLGQCEPGFGDCDADWASGCETALANDPRHCGGCDVVCREGFACDASRCRDARHVAELGLGERFACARRLDGQVSCWGDNRLGQLGSPEPKPNAALPVPIPVAALAQLSVGYDSACGIERGIEDAPDGEVSCWGSPLRGTTAVDLTSCPAEGCDQAPHRIGLRARQVCTGFWASCAVTGATGNVQCWGYDADLLGRDTNEGSPRPAAVVDANGDPLLGASQVACGMWESCAALEPTGVVCWGLNLRGVLGVPNAELDVSHFARPIEAFAERAVQQLVVHQGTGCALSDGRVLCWGDNQNGALGRGLDWGSLPSSPEPVDVGLEHVVALSGRQLTFCAISAPPTGPRRLHCWGGGGGLFGPDDDELAHSSPEPLDFLGAVPLETAGGLDNLCMRLDADVGQELWCWGRGHEGQLGDGSRPAWLVLPVRVSSP